MFGFLMGKGKKSLHVNELDEYIGNIELIDIREPHEVKRGTIRTAKNIPMGNLLGMPEKYLSKEKEYYIMCQSGGRSGRACSKLSKQGYQVINVLGGYGSYSGSKRKTS